MLSITGRTSRANYVQNEIAESADRQTSSQSIASQVLQLQENERKRLSRELHDDIGQRLSLVASTVAFLVNQPASDSLKKKLTALRSDLDHLCSDVHTMSHNLHSFQLEHLGLQEALKDLVSRVGQCGKRVVIDVDDLREPSSREVALCFYRVAQEGLNNAVKHSKASTISLIAATVREQTYMVIQDNGVGFEVRAHVDGLGLISMRERLKLIQGSLRYESIIGRGTELWVSAPSDLYTERDALWNEASALNVA